MRSPLLRLSLVLALLVLMVAAPGGAVGTEPPPVPGTWAWQNPKPQGQSLRDVSFVDASEGWAVGYDGTIVHTSDGGATWGLQSSSTTLPLYAVDFPSADNGWVVGDSGVVLHTTDGGETWARVDTGAGTTMLLDVEFASATTGVMCGYDTMLRTTDGGATWHPIDVPAQQWRAVAFENATHGVAVGWNGQLIDTTDAFATWEGHASGTGAWLNGVAYGGSRAWAVGLAGTIRYSFNGGQDWQTQTTTETACDFYAVTFADANNGWAVGSGGTIIRTTDGGVNWVTQPRIVGNDLEGLDRAGSQLVAVGRAGEILTGTGAYNGWVRRASGSTERLFALSFVTPTEGWACGDDATLLHTTDAGATWTKAANAPLAYLSGIQFVDANHGWISSWGGAIYHTDDAGAHWVSQKSTWTLYDIRMLDAQNGWACGANGGLYHTSNGTDWTVQSWAVTEALEAVCFPDASHGWVVGEGGKIWHTENGGLDWAPQTSTKTSYLNDVEFTDPSNGWAVGADTTILRTTDGGTTWAPDTAALAQLDSRGRWVQTVNFVDAKHGWISASDNILYTRDGGATWTRQEGPAVWALGASFPDARHGYLAGVDGGIIALTAESAPPVTTMVPAAPAGWTKADFSFGLTASDNGGSGVSLTYCWLPPAATYAPYTPGTSLTVSNEGTTVVRYLSYDDVGNAETPKTATVRIDKTAPVTSCDATGTYGGPIAVRLIAGDALSGVASTRYSLDGGSWTTGTSVAVSTAGAHTLRYASTDAAGNAEAEKTATFTTLIGGGTPGQASQLAIAGATRVDTAVKASQAAFGRADTVILATAFNFPDALGGSSLAGALNAPLLLTNKDSLPSQVEAEIRRLGAKKAVILGSEAAVGKGAADRLAALLGGAANVKRIGGPDRYATAALIAAETVDTIGAASFDGAVFVATGENFPDALAASPLAAARRRPILLTRSASLPVATSDALTSLKVNEAVILGSAAAVSDSVAASIEAKAADVSRLAGGNRYQTAIRIARQGVTEGLTWDGVAIATGTNYPDALSGGVMCGRLGCVMLLTDPNTLTPDVKTELTSNKARIGTVRFLGSSSAIGTAVRDAVGVALK